MAARFWVSGGNGLWSSTTNWATTSGGASGASVPGTSDTATFNATSGAVTATLDVSPTIQTLTMTGFTGTLAYGTNSISLNSTGTVFTGSTTYSVTGTPVINVISTGSTAITVLPGATTEANSVSFNFTGGTYALTFLGSNTHVAKSVNFTGFAGTWNATSGVRIYGNLTLSTGMTLTASTLIMSFAATSGTQAITSNGKTMDFPVSFIGTGTIQLLDSMTVGSTRTTTFTNGTLDINGKTLTTGIFSTSNSNTRTLAFGTGNITCVSTAGGTVWIVLAGAITVTGTPVVNISCNTATATTVNVGGLSEANSISFNFTIGTYALTFLNSTNQSAKNVNFTGFSGSLGNANNARFVYGDWTFSSTMTVAAGTGGPTFASTSATPRTITCNGITWNCPVQFNGVGGNWVLADAMNFGTSGQLTHTNGTLDLNGKTATITTYLTGAGTKNLTFNNGTLLVTAAFNNAAPTGYTTTAGTGTGIISMNAAIPKTFTGAGSTYNCTLSNDGAGTLTISGSNTITTLANGVSPSAFTFTSGTTTTITNWSISGTSGNLATIISSVAGSAATLSKSSGTVIASYVSLKDSAATGGASWYADATCTNVSGNSGWVFGTTKYWVGGTGNWSTAARWSTSSGGAGGAGITLVDAAVFNSSSGGGTSTVDSNVSVQTLTMTGYTGTLAFGTNSISLLSTGTVYTGDTTYSVSGTPVINVTSTGSTAITVSPGAVTEANSISFNFTGGTYTLSFPPSVNGSARSVDFTGFSGTWNSRSTTSNFYIYGNFTLSTTMTVASYNFGINLFSATSGTQLITSNGKTFDYYAQQNGVGGTVKLVDNFLAQSFSIYNGTFDGNNKLLNTVLSSFGVGGSSTAGPIFIGNIISSTNINFYSSNIICNLFGNCTFAGYCILDSSINLSSYTFTCGNFSSTSSIIRSIDFGTGNITCNGAGGTLWDTSTATNLTISGTPVVNISNNSAAATTITTGAFSEANSISFNFTTGTYALTLTTSNVFKSLNFTGFSGTIVAGTAAFIYGDLTLSSAASSSTTGIWTLSSTSATTRIITSNGVTLGRPLTINGVGGSWQLADSLTLASTRTLTHNNGTIDLNGKTLNVGTRYTTATGTKNLTFNGGTLVCPAANTSSFNNASPTNFTTTAGTGTGKISMTAATAKTFVGGGSTFNCTLSNDGAGALTITGSSTFTTIANGVQPTTFTFTAGTTQTVTNWSVSGTAGNLVTVNSATAGTASNLSKSSGVVSADYLSIQDSAAAGGATWYAGVNSVNVSGNSGWIFTGPPAGNTGAFFFMF